jgi:3-deoxy-D-manno-octulosonic-acid transferase
MMLGLYRALTALGSPAISLYLLSRRARGKEDAARFGERFGRASRRRPAGPLAWVHAASVGEALSVLPAIARIGRERPHLAVLVTTGTVTSAALMAERLPATAFHQYVPVDRPDAVARFLDHWRPDLAIWVESELWPNLILAARARGIPLALVQGRLSERAFARWRRFPEAARTLLGAFAPVIAQNPAMAERFAALGAGAVAVADLKETAPPLPADAAALAALRGAIGPRRSWLAASTHPGEEAAIAAVLPAIRRAHPDLLTIVVPRHPARGPEVAAVFSGAGCRVAMRSAAGDAIGAADVYVADTIGELGLFYRLAPLALIGGSLVPHGGQNPFEAARLRAVPLWGPSVTNFAPMVAALAAANAGVAVADAAALAAVVVRLLGDARERDALAQRAHAVATAGADALERVLAALAPLLDRLSAAAPGGPDHARA